MNTIQFEARSGVPFAGLFGQQARLVDVSEEVVLGECLVELLSGELVFMPAVEAEHVPVPTFSVENVDSAGLRVAGHHW